VELEKKMGLAPFFYTLFSVNLICQISLDQRHSFFKSLVVLIYMDRHS